MKIKSCLLTLLIALSAIGITVCSYIYTPTKYKSISYSYEDAPLMTPLLKGAAKGIYPWSQVAQENPTEIKVKKKATNNLTEVKSFTQVTDDYFDDAIFVGDSRMVGLSMYCQPIYSRARFFAKKSLSIYDIRDDAWVENEDGTTSTLFEALSEVSFKKVYIMVGINELGRGSNEDYKDAYEEVIDRILDINPEAYIFINSTMHVTKEKSDGDPIYNNGAINVRNMEIVPLADQRQIFFLNINDAVDDEEGNLNSDYTSDGIHLKGSCYEPWHQYLLFNGIEVK